MWWLKEAHSDGYSIRYSTRHQSATRNNVAFQERDILHLFSYKTLLSLNVTDILPETGSLGLPHTSFCKPTKPLFCLTHAGNWRCRLLSGKKTRWFHQFSTFSLEKRKGMTILVSLFSSRAISTVSCETGLSVDKAFLSLCLNLAECDNSSENFS